MKKNAKNQNAIDNKKGMNPDDLSISELTQKLDRSYHIIDELVKVNQMFGHDYDRDKAYAEDPSEKKENQPIKSKSVNP
jgi:hypothetical protein